MLPTIQQARDLVEHFGSQRAAADAIGVHHTTVNYWVNREARCAAKRNRYRDNPEPKKARERRRYDELSGVDYNRKLLLQRRVKALHRRRQDAGGL